MTMSKPVLMCVCVTLMTCLSLTSLSSLQGDWGGQRTLQRKWTSFLKARLVCSVPDYELHLNVLRSVFVLEGRDINSTVFYGIFGLEW